MNVAVRDIDLWRQQNCNAIDVKPVHDGYVLHLFQCWLTDLTSLYVSLIWQINGLVEQLASPSASYTEETTQHRLYLSCGILFNGI